MIDEFNDHVQDRLAQLLARSEAKRRVAIIGAGTSGLIACQKLLEADCFPIVFEKTGTVGGVWSLDGHPAMYPGLVMNTSPLLTIFRNSAPPDPDKFLHYGAKKYARYVNKYFSKTKVSEHIINFSEIKHCEIDPSGGSYLSLLPKGSSTIVNRLHFDNIVYAGGLCQKVPDQNSKSLANYQGQVIHSSEVENPSLFYKNRVLIIGSGNTACDLATKIFACGAAVDISIRNGTWILPRSIDNIPIDEFVQSLKRYFGEGYKSNILHAIEPNRCYFTHNTNTSKIDFRVHRISISDSLPLLIKNNDIRIRGVPMSSEHDSIVFSDGSKARYDAVINCTGYEVNFDSRIAHSNRHLLAGVMTPELPGWWFIGAPAVWGGSPALAEWQADIIAAGIKHQISASSLLDVTNRVGKYDSSAMNLPFGFAAIDFHDYALFSSNLIEEINIL